MNGTTRFKKIYLHIGLGKTGTTSIQADLLREGRVLESKFDLHFPRSFPQLPNFDGNHSIPLRAIYHEHPDVRKRLAAQGLQTQAQIDAYNADTLRGLQQGFEKSSASQLLLSAEGVGHFRKPDLIALSEWLRSLSEQVVVIACLRHPAAALSSEIQQRLYIGDVLEDLYERPPFYRYKGLFERLEAAFPRESIILYDFAHAVRNPGGLTSEFFSRLGIDTGDLFQPKPAANTSMSHEAALLLSALNKQRPVLIDGGPNPRRKRGDSQALGAVPGRKYIAPNHVYHKLNEQAQPHLQWLEQEYGIVLDRGTIEESDTDHQAFSDRAIDAVALAMVDRVPVDDNWHSNIRAGSNRARRFWERLKITG